jgi:hypothetical protein
MLTRTLRIALLLLVLGALVGCPVRGSSSGDDDDAADDDDSAVADDDDATGDDDDATGDDDDATGDDDDATFVEGNSTLSGIWFVSYWVDAASTLPHCQQAYRFDGLAEARLNVLGNSCPSCTAKIDIVNILDVTAGIASGDPFEANYNVTVTTPCTAASFTGGQTDYGTLLSSTTASPGGDYLLTQGLIDDATGIAEGIPLTVSGDPTIASLRADYAGSNVTLTHLGYVNAASGGALTELGLDAVALPAPPTTTFWPFWTYYTSAGATDGRMLGQYGIGSLWLLNSNNQGIDYETVTFSGSLIGQ